MEMTENLNLLRFEILLKKYSVNFFKKFHKYTLYTAFEIDGIVCAVEVEFTGFQSKTLLLLSSIHAQIKNLIPASTQKYSNEIGKFRSRVLYRRGYGITESYNIFLLKNVAIYLILVKCFALNVV